MAISAERMLFTADRYEKMIAAGVLAEDDRVELIEGEIINMAPIGLKHAACVARLSAIFAARLGPSAVVWAQNPIRLSDNSEPQPDVALLKPRSDFYAESRPTAQDVLLLVEVADTTLATDRRVKASLYAEAGIGAYWIVDLSGEVIEVYTEPQGTAYRQVQRVAKGDRLVVPGVAGLYVTVGEVLGL